MSLPLSRSEVRNTRILQQDLTDFLTGSELENKNVVCERQDGRLLGLKARLVRHKFVCSYHRCFPCSFECFGWPRCALRGQAHALVISMNIRYIDIEATMTRAERPLGQYTLRVARSAV